MSAVKMADPCVLTRGFTPHSVYFCNAEGEVMSVYGINHVDLREQRQLARDTDKVTHFFYCGTYSLTQGGTVVEVREDVFSIPYGLVAPKERSGVSPEKRGHSKQSNRSKQHGEGKGKSPSSKRNLAVVA